MLIPNENTSISGISAIKLTKLRFQSPDITVSATSRTIINDSISDVKPFIKPIQPAPVKILIWTRNPALACRGQIERRVRIGPELVWEAPQEVVVPFNI